MESIKREEFKENGSMQAEVEPDYGMPLFELALRSRQKINNSMAASISSQVMGIRNDSIRDSLTSFDGVSHRMEYVASVRGVMYINDSKATNINSVWFSLESIESTIILILGGNVKDVDYDIIKERVSDKVRAVICLGEDNAPIHHALDSESHVVDAESLEDAVRTAYLLAAKGDVVLFSPACASFGQFRNYEDRGNQFSKAVREL